MYSNLVVPPARVWSKIPLFTFSDGTGGTMSAWQRQDMLVAVVHTAGCSRCDALRTRLSAMSAPDVRVVRVTIADPNEDPETFSSRRIARAIGEAPGEARLVVCDRTARVFAALNVHEVPLARLWSDAEAWLDHVRSQANQSDGSFDWSGM
jgi:hypothetical protein